MTSLRSSLLITFLLFGTILCAQEIGLQMLCVRDIEDPEKALAKVNEWGIKYVEGGVPGSMDREEYKSLLKKYDVKIIATGAGFEQLRDDIQPVIDNAKDLGAQYVICYWIPHDGDNFTMENMQAAVDVFNAAGKKLKENGLTLCYHPHGYEFRKYDGPGTLFDYMMENTQAEYVSYQMDVFWIRNPGQDPAAILRKYPDRFSLLHLKDRKPGTPDNQNGRQDVESNVVLGTGDVGIAEVMKAAKEIGIPYAIIEDESSRALKQVPKSLEYLKTL